MRCGVASPLTSNTIPVVLESTGTRSPVTYCSGTLMAPSLGVSDLATMTPLRTRVILPGSITSVSLLLVTMRTPSELFVTETREVSLAELPSALELTETRSPAEVSTWRPRPLSTATSEIADPISTVSAAAVKRVGSNSDTFPEESSATNVLAPATPTWISVVGNCIEAPRALAMASMGMTAPLVWSCTTGFAPPSCLMAYSVPLNWRALMVETTCSVSELYSTSCWLIGSATRTLPSETSSRWARTPAPASTGIATAEITTKIATSFGSFTLRLWRAKVLRMRLARPVRDASVAAGTSPELTSSHQISFDALNTCCLVATRETKKFTNQPTPRLRAESLISNVQTDEP
jgi:hypothetical protein